MLLTLLLAACTGTDGADTAAACGGAGTLCTIAGTGTAGLGGEGTPATETHLYLPIDATVGPDGLLYILDWNNHRIRVLDEDGNLSTLAGTGELGDGPEGPAIEAKFNHPTNLAFDSSGRLLISAWHNSRIMRIDLTTDTLEFVAGDGTRSFGGDGGDPKAAKLDLPSGIALNSRDEIFIGDQANQRIRCVTTENLMDTIGGVGTAGFSGDGGPAVEAEMHASVGQAASPANRLVITDDDKMLYFVDTENHRVRQIDLTTGTIDTYVGNGTPGYGGDGGDRLGASLYQPTDLALGPDGEMYIADTSNSCVRRVDPDGVISTFAGRCGELGYEGDGGAPQDALLNRPYGVEVDPAGNVYISDTYNQVVRVVYK